VSKCPSYFVCFRPNLFPPPRTVSICKSTHNSAKTYRTGPVFSVCIPAFLLLSSYSPPFLPLSSHSVDPKCQPTSAPPEMEIAENSTPPTKLRQGVYWERNSCCRTSTVHIFMWTTHRQNLLLFPVVHYLLSALFSLHENRRTCSIQWVIYNIFLILKNKDDWYHLRIMRKNSYM